MRLALLTSLTMVAFAANSVLTRAGVDRALIDPASFALIRVSAGILTLFLILTVRGGQVVLFRKARVIGALSLAAYMAGFSLSYLTLDAGVGALILFGVVQITMFGWSALRGAQPSRRQLSGAAIAFAGLVLVLWPEAGSRVDVGGSALMVLAGLGWAAYTVSGKSEADPLAATAVNFAAALPVLALFLMGPGMFAQPSGIALAFISGAVTSGLGYALWYSLLKDLPQSTAAVVQLSVPLIAIAGGAALLGEGVALVLVLAASLVVGGIALSVTTPKAPEDHRQ